MFGGVGGGNRARRVSQPGTGFGIPGSSTLPQQEDDFHGLTFYEFPPQGETSMQELSDACLRRLHVLQNMDQRMGVDFNIYQLQKFATEYEGLLTQDGFKFPVGISEQERDHMVTLDQVSHTMLRVAFSNSREKQQWFLEQEYRLFCHRLDALSKKQRERFYKEQNILQNVELETDQQMVNFLQQVTPYCKSENSFFKVPFHKIPGAMLKRRSVVVRAGTAWVPGKQFTRIVATDFKTQLQNLLTLAQAQHPRISRDPRAGPLVQMLQMAQLVTKQFDASQEDDAQKLTLHNFEALLKRSFPPCMRMLVDNQRQHGHLKHQGRFQLRTFFKSCGMVYDDHMRWWKQELLRYDAAIDSDKFEKNYAYDVKHAHGKVGNMKGSRAFGCSAIINFPYPSQGQAHGCPFKHKSTETLIPMLKGWGVSENGVKEIKDKIDNGKHYQLACVSCFSDLHDGADGGQCGNHPVQYFQESCKFNQEKLDKLATPGRAGDTEMGEVPPKKEMLATDQPMFS